MSSKDSDFLGVSRILKLSLEAARSQPNTTTMQVNDVKKVDSSKKSMGAQVAEKADVRKIDISNRIKGIGATEKTDARKVDISKKIMAMQVTEKADVRKVDSSKKSMGDQITEKADVRKIDSSNRSRGIDATEKTDVRKVDISKKSMSVQITKNTDVRQVDISKKSMGVQITKKADVRQVDNSNRSRSIDATEKTDVRSVDISKKSIGVQITKKADVRQVDSSNRSRGTDAIEKTDVRQVDSCKKSMGVQITENTDVKQVDSSKKSMGVQITENTDVRQVDSSKKSMGVQIIKNTDKIIMQGVKSISKCSCLVSSVRKGLVCKLGRGRGQSLDERFSLDKKVSEYTLSKTYDLHSVSSQSVTDPSVDGSEISKMGREISVDGSKISKMGRAISVDGSEISKMAREISVNVSKISKMGRAISVDGSEISKMDIAVSVDGSKSSKMDRAISVDGSESSKKGREVSVDGSESSKTAREVFVATLANDICVGEQEKDKIALAKQSICELPDLAMCEDSPENINDIPMAEKINSDMRKPKIIRLPLSGNPHKNPSATEGPKSSLATYIASCTKTSSSSSRERYRREDEQTVQKTPSLSAVARKTKKLNCTDLNKSTKIEEIFQEHSAHHRVQQVSLHHKTAVDMIVTNTSKSTKQSIVNKQGTPCGGKSRGLRSECCDSTKQIQCQETVCSLDRETFKLKVCDFKLEDVDKIIDQIQMNKEVTFIQGRHLQNELIEKEDCNIVSEHAGQAGEVAEEIIIDDTVLSKQTRPAGEVDEEIIIDDTVLSKQTRPAGEVAEEIIIDDTVLSKQTRPAGEVDEEIIIDDTVLSKQTRPAGEVAEEIIIDDTILSKQTRPAGEVAGEIIIDDTVLSRMVDRTACPTFQNELKVSEQLDDQMPLHVSTSKSRCAMSEQEQTVCLEVVDCDPSVSKMLHAIYKSYELETSLDVGGQPIIVKPLMEAEKDIFKDKTLKNASPEDADNTHRDNVVSPTEEEITKVLGDSMSATHPQRQTLRNDETLSVENTEKSQEMKISYKKESSVQLDHSSDLCSKPKLHYVQDRPVSDFQHYSLSHAVAHPARGLCHEMSLPPREIYQEKSLPTADLCNAFKYTESNCEVISIPAGGNCDPISIPTEGNCDAISVPAGGNCDIISIPAENNCDGISVPAEGSCNEMVSIPAGGCSSNPCMAQPDYVSGSDNKQYSNVNCIPLFQVQEFSLPAETVGSKLAMDKMVEFLKSCSKDIQEQMKNKQENHPANVTIKVSLTSASPSDQVPRHSHQRYETQAERPHYVSPFMFQPPVPAPYLYWTPWSKGYSSNMNRSINNVPSDNICCSEMINPHPTEDSSDRELPVSSRTIADCPNPWMYSYWNWPQFHHKPPGTAKTSYAHMSDPSQTWRNYCTQDVITAFSTTDMQAENNEGCDRQEMLNPNEAETHRERQGECEEVTSSKHSETFSSSQTKKQNNETRLSTSTDTLNNMSTETLSASSTCLSQRSHRETRARSKNAQSTCDVGNLLTKDLVKNKWIVSTSPPPTNNLQDQLITMPPTAASSRSLSRGSAQDTEIPNIQMFGHTGSLSLTQNNVPNYACNVTKNSLARYDKMQASIRRLNYPAQDESQTRRRLSAPGVYITGPQEKVVHSELTEHPGLDGVSLQSDGIGHAGVGQEGRHEPVVASSVKTGKASHNKKRVRAIEWMSMFFARSRDYQYSFIDCHCHIDLLYARLNITPETTFTKFRQNYSDTFPQNYEGCVAVFCHPNTFTTDNPQDQILKCISAEEGVWIAVGCHPKNATQFEDTHMVGLRQILKHPKVIALGEIGLDYSGSFGQHSERQKQVFRQQLQLAVQLGLPLVIHCRDADDDCLQILVEMVPQDYKIHAHCFTRDITVAMRWMMAFPNLFLGLTPVITYKTAVEAANTATYIPLDRLLLETDAPYFVPNSMRNGSVQHSHPGFALCTAERVAELKNIPVDEVLRACRENTHKMYGI